MAFFEMDKMLIRGDTRVVSLAIALAIIECAKNFND